MTRTPLLALTLTLLTGCVEWPPFTAIQAGYEDCVRVAIVLTEKTRNGPMVSDGAPVPCDVVLARSEPDPEMVKACVADLPLPAECVPGDAFDAQDSADAGDASETSDSVDIPETVDTADVPDTPEETTDDALVEVDASLADDGTHLDTAADVEVTTDVEADASDLVDTQGDLGDLPLDAGTDDAMDTGPEDVPVDCESLATECVSVTADPETGGCVFTNLTGPCDDGSECTDNDACFAGECSGVQSVDCNDGVQCTVDICDPATGNCSNTTNNGASCDDGDPCTGGDVCSGQTCAGIPLTWSATVDSAYVEVHDVAAEPGKPTAFVGQYGTDGGGGFWLHARDLGGAITVDQAFGDGIARAVISAGDGWYVAGESKLMHIQEGGGVGWEEPLTFPAKSVVQFGQELIVAGGADITVVAGYSAATGAEIWSKTHQLTAPGQGEHAITVLPGPGGFLIGVSAGLSASPRWLTVNTTGDYVADGTMALGQLTAGSYNALTGHRIFVTSAWGQVDWLWNFDTGETLASTSSESGGAFDVTPSGMGFVGVGSGPGMLDYSLLTISTDGGASASSAMIGTDAQPSAVAATEDGVFISVSSPASGVAQLFRLNASGELCQ